MLPPASSTHVRHLTHVTRNHRYRHSTSFWAKKIAKFLSIADFDSQTHVSMLETFSQVRTSVNVAHKMSK